MKSLKRDAILYRYHEFLKDMYVQSQYIEPISITDMIAKHEIGKIVPRMAIELGFYKNETLNGKKIRGRYTWTDRVPDIDMAISLMDNCTSKRRIKRYTNKPTGYFQVKSYLFGLIKIEKWIEK